MNAKPEKRDIKQNSAPIPSPYTPPEKKESIHDLRSLGLKFKATADWMVMRQAGRPIAEMFYVFYEQESKGKGKNVKQRPLTFLFNGGPGASSAYLHVGTAGPWRADFGKRGEFLEPPVSVQENQETWLPFSDLVFIDPIGTGFSRAVEESRNEREPFRYDKGERDDKSKLLDRAQQETQEFFAISRDIELLVQFITQFLTRYNRWESPISIAGESYGGFRVGKLVRALHESGGVALRSAILVSPALDLVTHDSSDYDVLSWLDHFPSLAQTALFHGKSRQKVKGGDLLHFADHAESFAQQEFSKLLISGDLLAASEKKKIITKLADFIGLKQSYVDQKGGRVLFWLFIKELLRDEQLLCGMYDASGVTTDAFPSFDWSQGPDHAVSLSSAFASAVQAILKSKLNIQADREYHLLSYDVFTKWRNDQSHHFMHTQLNSVNDLRFGIAVNPYLRVLITHGYYDLVTPYFTSKRLVAHMRLTAQQKKQVQLINYQGGHMYYTWERSRKDFTKHVRQVLT